MGSNCPPCTLEEKPRCPGGGHVIVHLTPPGSFLPFKPCSAALSRLCASIAEAEEPVEEMSDV